MRWGYVKICSAGGERLLNIASEGKTILQVQFLREIRTRTVGTLVWILVPCFSKMNDHFNCRYPLLLTALQYMKIMFAM